MIYLTRTTVDLDGTRTTEIAALEDGVCLKRYEAQGFTACSYEVYCAAWRGNHTRLYERLLWEAGRRPAAPAVDVPVYISAPCCRVLAFRQASGGCRCSSCGRQVRKSKSERRSR